MFILKTNVILFNQCLREWSFLLFNICFCFIISEKETKTKKRKVINTGSDGDQNMVMKAVEIQDAKLDQIDPISEGWEAESILGATEVDSQIHFLIQW